MRDVPTSCTDPSALNLYGKALTEYQSYVGDPIATIEEALKESPDFIIGHIFRATIFLTMTEKRFLGEARSSLDAATALLPYANARERILTTAVRHLVKANGMPGPPYSIMFWWTILEMLSRFKPLTFWISSAVTVSTCGIASLAFCLRGTMTCPAIPTFSGCMLSVSRNAINTTRRRRRADKRSTLNAKMDGLCMP
jgi:hypothetical protein